ncbi:MAG TPA: ferredoxin family protein [Candidatus Krumholzibacteriaceae bacterium]|jgi:2-oxoglutarate ferredoxin oxidoreductase subunit delta|nr:ferredoxin family protein [Candidatus Krumholzibacteriaceae bacterium]
MKAVTTTKKLWRKPLDADKAKQPQAEIYIIKDRCKGCGYCIAFCPKEVLEESEEINARGAHPPKVKDISKCAVCGYCMAICPDLAIFVKEKTDTKKEAEKDERKE